MAEVRWTIQAVDDLESIAQFVASDSPHFAQLLISDIFEIASQLSTFPERGRIVPELNIQNIREILFGNYRIIYRTKSSVIEIITVYHGSRLLASDRLI